MRGWMKMERAALREWAWFPVPVNQEIFNWPIHSLLEKSAGTRKSLPSRANRWDAIIAL